MGNSFLRKRRPQNQSTQPTRSIRHSLSLPDLTTPLLDTASWDWQEVPSFSPDIPNIPQVQGHGQGFTRYRKPSLVPKVTGAVQFHKPFSATAAGDFRTSAWTDAEGPAASFGKGRRTKGKNKILKRLNVVVVGGKGVGKTSMISLLETSLVELPSRLSPSQITDSANPSSPTAPGPPVTGNTKPLPTTTISLKSIETNLDNHEKTLFRIIDTPGLELGNDGNRPSSKAAERERGVSGLLMLIEEQFRETLKEERKVVRQQGRGEEDMVHLVLYIIDAGAVLRPKVDNAVEPPVDWSSAGLFDHQRHPPSPTTLPDSPKLAAAEIAVIQRLSHRVTVLPILSRSDGLTINELNSVRQAVRRDLAAAFPDDKGKGFGFFGEEEEEDSASDSSFSSFESPGTSPISRPVPPASNAPGVTSSRLPFAIFAPETRKERRFAWGAADVTNPDHSDFIRLRDAILENQTMLRTSTREVMYERYRTEKLLAREEKV